MTELNRWQLPEGIEEILPARAAAVEKLRRELLDLYKSWGYQLVIPPLMEFTESLLIGLGSDIDLLTFKMTDQLSGRSLAIRADMTPQVARIDAHSMAEPDITRLCYAGSTLHTRPKSLMASRSPVQLGAELYGENSHAADVEVISLMLATLRAAGVAGISLDLGHVGVYQAVVDEIGLSEELEAVVFDALQRKSVPDLEIALANSDEKSHRLVLALVDLHGDESVLARARDLLAEDVPEAIVAIDALEEVARDMRLLDSDLSIYFDLAELRGFHYHTGIVFAAYVAAHGHALANGGRYDDVGAVFGRARPATGFATDLKALLSVLPQPEVEAGAIAAPMSDDPSLREAVEKLRVKGEVVINSLASSVDARCDRELKSIDGSWQVTAL